MSDRYNLIYNGDFSEGTTSWSGTNLSVTNGVLTVTGNLGQSLFIPVASDRRYRLSFDYRVTTNDGKNPIYIALWPYDSSRSSMISIVTTLKLATNADTTLAAALTSGSTTVSLTSTANWPTSATYQRVGICDVLAWGTNRCSQSLPYSSISGTTVTLKSAYTGSTIAAGTKVAPFSDGGTYYYPWSRANASLSSDWESVSVEFNGGNSMRYSCQYIQFHTLGYSHTYQMRNLRLECISDIQHCVTPSPNDKTFKITKTGLMRGEEFFTAGMPIRYIRNTTSGSTANTSNHWCEIEAYNQAGSNIAWHKKTNGAYTVATDGTVNSSYWGYGSGTATATLDLEFIENISKIKIWHYYPDGRTYYNDIVEVSQDGSKWYKVYQGQKAETAAGNEIILPSSFASIKKSSDVFGQDIIEY